MIPACCRSTDFYCKAFVLGAFPLAAAVAAAAVAAALFKTIAMKEKNKHLIPKVRTVAQSPECGTKIHFDIMPASNQKKQYFLDNIT